MSRDDVLGASSPKSTLGRAVVWSYSLTWGKQAITAALSFVLAAMLGPRAFGVIAMALVFTSFIQMLQQQGLMPAIISRNQLTDVQKDTAFWMVVGAGLLLTAVGVLVAPWWAALNRLPELTHIIQAIALGIPLSSSVVVHEAILRRDLQFKRLAIRSWTSVLAGGVAGLIGAMLGWEVWALVAQQLVTVVTEVLVLWGVSPWRPRFRWSPTAARELWSYSARSASSSLGLFLGGRMDIILGGAFFGPAMIGLYRMGQRVTEMVLDTTARGMQSVSLPGLSEVQDDHEAFQQRFLGMLRQATCLAFPLFGVVAGLSNCIERFLGPDWQGTAMAISLLSLVQAIRSISMLVGPALQAQGRPGTLSLLMWLFTLLNVVGLVVASRLPGGSSNLAPLCVAMLVATAVGSAVMLIVAGRRLGIRLAAMARSWIPGAVAGIIGAGSTYIAYRVTEQLPWLIAGGIAGMVGIVLSAVVLMALVPAVRLRLRAPFHGGRGSQATRP